MITCLTVRLKQLDWSSKFPGNHVGNTAGFGQIWDGRPFWVVDFTGDGKTDILFYYPGDGNWWLGSYDGSEIKWRRVAKRFIICGVNYYPALHSWEQMWTEWAPTEIAAELGKAQELAVNTLRMFICDYNNFGASNCTSSISMFDRFDQFLNIASIRKIKCIVTLFEGDPEKFVHDIEGSKKFIDCFAQRFGQDPRILMWDIVNEPDGGAGFLDSSGNWKQSHLIWLKSVYQYLKSKVVQPITLGSATGVDPIKKLWQEPIFRDLIPQYHEYSHLDPLMPFFFVKKVRDDINSLWEGFGRRPIFCRKNT